MGLLVGGEGQVEERASNVDPAPVRRTAVAATPLAVAVGLGEAGELVQAASPAARASSPAAGATLRRRDAGKWRRESRDGIVAVLSARLAC
jgi:hypothetical protein